MITYLIYRFPEVCFGSSQGRLCKLQFQKDTLASYNVRNESRCGSCNRFSHSSPFTLKSHGKREQRWNNTTEAKADECRLYQAIFTASCSLKWVNNTRYRCLRSQTPVCREGLRELMKTKSPTTIGFIHRRRKKTFISSDASARDEPLVWCCVSRAVQSDRTSLNNALCLHRSRARFTLKSV